MSKVKHDGGLQRVALKPEVALLSAFVLRVRSPQTAVPCRPSAAGHHFVYVFDGVSFWLSLRSFPFAFSFGFFLRRG